VLGRILGVLGRPEHVPAEREDAPLVPVEQDAERVVVTGAKLLDEPLVGHEAQDARGHVKAPAERHGVFDAHRGGRGSGMCSGT
jgi:hypothetical protein